MNFLLKIRLPKRLIILTIAACFSSLVLSVDLKSAFEKYSIIPDVIDILPKSILEVKYPSGVEAILGNEVSSTGMKDIPLVKWQTENDALYMLALLDPDVDNKPNSTECKGKHWLVINIPGRDINKGETLVEYVGSDAQRDSGAHRYVFLVFKQNNRIVLSDMRPMSGKMKDQIAEFAQKYSLGELIAANFFQTHFDN